jgi:hypothetical protein
MSLCKPFLPDNREGDYESGCLSLYEVVVYNQMLTRISPYIMGIIVAQMYLEELEAPNLLIEWAAFAGFLFIGQVGVQGWLNSRYLPPSLNTVWQCIGRQIYGLIISYLLF